MSVLITNIGIFWIIVLTNLKDKLSDGATTIGPGGGCTSDIIGWQQSARFPKEGDTLILACYFQTYGTECNDTDVTWTLNGQVITPNNRMEINTTYWGDNFESDLTIDPLYARDEGEITCHHADKSISFPINITALPVLAISPNSVAVNEGGNVSIMCSVINTERTNPQTFHWCHNSVIIQGISNTGYMSVLRLINVRESDSGEYRCSVRTQDPCSDIGPISGIYVYKAETLMCMMDFDEYKLTWGVAPADFLSTQACPRPFTGIAERYCDVFGKWEPTIMIKCIRQEINKALEDLIYLEVSPGNKTEVIGNVINTISNITNSSDILSSGDLNGTTVVLDKIISIIQDSSGGDIHINEQAFVEVVDDMLSAKHQDSWKEVNEKSELGASVLMRTIENFGTAISNTVETDVPIYIYEPNIVVEIRRTLLNEHVISFKPNATSNGTGSGIYLNLGTGDIVFTAALYKTISDILPNEDRENTYFSTEVLGLSVVGVNTEVLTSPVIITFDTDESVVEKRNLSRNIGYCVFWDFDKTGDWSSAGCEWINESCQCNHLTNFAVLMSPIKILDRTTSFNLRLITLVCCSLSILSTVATIAVYLSVWRHVKNDKSRLLLNLCVALTFAYLLFLTGIDKTQNHVVCMVITAFLHYFFLATFCIMLAEGIQLLMSVTVVFYAKSKLKLLLLLGWGFPAVIVAVTIGITHEKYHSDHHCWLTISNGVIYSFIGPTIGIIIVNIGVIVRVLVSIYSSHFIVTKTQRQKIMAGVRSVSVLLPILGITWLFGILSINEDLVAFQYLFAVFNGLQGLFIFLFYCVFNASIRAAMENKIRKYKSTTLSSKLANNIQTPMTPKAKYIVNGKKNFRHNCHSSVNNLFKELTYNRFQSFVATAKKDEKG